jgi:hypothetical protein
MCRIGLGKGIRRCTYYNFNHLVREPGPDDFHQLLVEVVGVDANGRLHESRRFIGD